MLYKVKRFINKLVKIVQYLPILWKDEDWDYSYLLDLIEFKLSRIKNCIRKDSIIVPNQARDLTIDINKVKDHIYNYQNAWEIYDKIHDGLSFDTCAIPISTKNGCTYMMSINKSTFLPLTKEEDEKYTNYIKAVYNFEQKEWGAIWDSLKEHGQEWWD